MATEAKTLDEKIQRAEDELGVHTLGDKPILYLDNAKTMRFIDEDDENTLDNKLKEIQDLMDTDGSAEDETGKDELYKKAQGLWGELSLSLSDTEFNIFLNRKEYSYLTDLLLKKMDYDVNTIFFAIELTDYLVSMRELADYENDEDMGSFPITATDITYMYHLIKEHKVKGLTKGTYTFASILRRIGDVSKMFKYYDNQSKEVAKDIQDWVVTFDKGVSAAPPVAIDTDSDSELNQALSDDPVYSGVTDED